MGGVGAEYAEQDRFGRCFWGKPAPADCKN